MLNLERLRTLDALARHGSVSAAADALHVTTSAVSQQLGKLEREVGQQLLAKNGRGVRLTDAGRLLSEHAARILSQVELAESDLEAQRGQVVGELRLSAFPTAARGLFPVALQALRAQHPGLRVRSSELEPEQGIAGVVRGDLDLAVVLGSLDRHHEGSRSAGEQADDLIGGGAEGRGALDGVQQADAATGAGTEVDQPSALPQGLGDRLDGTPDLREGVAYGEGDGLVFGVHDREQFGDRHAVQFGGPLVARLGAECAECAEVHDVDVLSWWR